MWAEAFGIGELGLMPNQFWSLTMREFWLKHDAFMRAEDRALALMYEHSLMSAPRKEDGQRALSRRIRTLRRYPTQAWRK